MIRINLLPYREERRRNQILQYLVIALSTLGITAVLMLAVYSWSSIRMGDAEHRLQDVQARNRAVTAKIGELGKFKEVKADVQKKLDLVHMLQRGRFHSLESMLGLSVAIPKNVWLTRVDDSGNTISVSGYGESNRSIAMFMRALEDQKIFSKVNLEVIKRELRDGVVLRSFSLSMIRIDSSATGQSEEKPDKTS
jgi:type IV pilus assembly protein PilN